MKTEFLNCAPRFQYARLRRMAPPSPHRSPDFTPSRAETLQLRPGMSYLLLAASTMLCLLPVSGRAFHVDDTLFVWAAQNIAKHPFNPYGFDLNWDNTPVRMSELTKNPPLASYYMALIGSIAGWSERALHLSFLLPALALVLGTYRLAQKFTRSAMLAAFGTLLTPGLLVSASSVMCDVMMLAIWIWAAIFWIEGVDTQRQLFYLASAALISAAALTKYFGASLIFLLLAYSLVHQRRLGVWALYLIVPCAVLLAYEMWSAKLYGHGLIFDAVSFSDKQNSKAASSAAGRVLTAISHAGGCTLPALFLAPVLWSRRQVAIGLLCSGAAAWLMIRGKVRLGVLLGSPVAVALRHPHKLLIGVHLIFFIAGGISLLALAVADYWRERDANSLFLGSWVLGTFVFSAFVNWTINARTLLPLIPGVGILLARRLERFRNRFPRRLVASSIVIALSLSALISLWIVRADSEIANTARSNAFAIAEWTRPQGGTLWFMGHWGFQYYMEQLGGHPVDQSHPQTKTGDFVAIPFNNIYPWDVSSGFSGSKERFPVQYHSYGSTICPDLGADFYTAHWGLIPYVIGPIPRGYYMIVRLKR